ncbi:MAG TPA: beta-propeller domain-containing protein [Polyangiaceae bacterium]|nr:beta-propeller domain-containing protein [Polyangiaceae bacterium]
MPYQTKLTCALWLGLAATVASAGFLGCSDRPGEGGGCAPGCVVSDEPSGSIDTGYGGGGGGAPPSVLPYGAHDDAIEQAIYEADVVQVKDNRLYALSSSSGLNVIDVSVTGQLTLLGRYRSNGVSSDMIFNGDTLYVMTLLSSSSQSRVEALDVSDPANIQALGSIDIDGEFTGLRLKGDVLYTVTRDVCGSGLIVCTTTVTSLQIADPTNISLINQLSYITTEDYDDKLISRIPQHVLITSDRMYVPALDADGDGEWHPRIHVIDISNPSGELVAGADVDTKGPIRSRSQMDEVDGVLRVISEPLYYNELPLVQTFSVASAQDVNLIAEVDLNAPGFLSLNTLSMVRFDGTRAYAAPLYYNGPWQLTVIDLSDPSQPQIAGEIDVSGSILRIEPRGDRLFTLAYVPSAPDGALSVSLFDVSNPAQPTLIQREAFGGPMEFFTQQKCNGLTLYTGRMAFKVMDDHGLIVVPYGGFHWNAGCGSDAGGVQLLDFTTDSLVKRGLAASGRDAQRAFLLGGRLFTASDTSVTEINIDNKDAPVTTSELSIVRAARQTAVARD